jgi:hypothetical protein
MIAPRLLHHVCADRGCRYMKILNERADLISSIELLTEQNGELKMLLNE